MAFCSKCKRPFDDQADFCPYDGTALSPGDPGLGGNTADHAPSASSLSEDSKVVAISAMSSSTGAMKLAADARRPSSVYRGLIGKTLDGRYRIESVLGEGGMGIVFLAKHVVIEKQVAVKVLKKDAARNESVAKRFVREAQAASRIAHPNIIDVTDFGTTKNGIIYSVMEYVEGSTLAKVVRNDAPLPVERVLRITAQMARALEAAHNKGVVHRDLKPENVFLVDRDERRDFVKIVDFGIARVLPIPGNSEVSRLTRVGTVFGTPEYMAPEQASGRSDTDHRVDIYALGTIMYEMLSGAVPHRGDSTVRTLAMQMLDPVTPLSELPTCAGLDPKVEAVVMKALEKKREDRWDDMASMLKATLQLSDTADTLQVTASQVPTAQSSTTMLEGPPTEVESNPAGALAAEESLTTEHLPGRNQQGRGMTAAPTELYQVLTPKGEPAFVRRRKRPSIHDLIDEDPPQDTDGGSKVWIVGLALAVAAMAVVAIVLLVGGDRTGAAASETETAGSGSALAQSSTGDAGTGATAVVETVKDAAPDVSDVEDASGRTGKRPRDRVTNNLTPKRNDAGITSLGPDVTIEVITRPDGGSLFNGSAYAGSSGVVISRPHGTKLKLRCGKKGYKNGYVTIRFGIDEDLAVCRMRKKTKCVKDLKNPYAKCP